MFLILYSIGHSENIWYSKSMKASLSLYMPFDQQKTNMLQKSIEIRKREEKKNIYSSFVPWKPKESNWLQWSVIETIEIVWTNWGRMKDMAYSSCIAERKNGRGDLKHQWLIMACFENWEPFKWNKQLFSVLIFDKKAQKRKVFARNLSSRRTETNWFLFSQLHKCYEKKGNKIFNIN